MRNRFASIATIALALAVLSPISSSNAATCVPVKAKGATVGSIAVGSTSMQIKSFTYPAGGVMEPQKTTTAAGLSDRHMPLSSKVGTSVIAWHRDYDGCVNALNIFMEKSVGDTFKITDENGQTVKYRLTLIKDVGKGDYKSSWFTLIGPRQIAMFTCTGVFKSGHYEKNVVFIAVPA
jgi:hypothetical protein